MAIPGQVLDCESDRVVLCKGDHGVCSRRPGSWGLMPSWKISGKAGARGGKVGEIRLKGRWVLSSSLISKQTIVEF